MPVFLILPEYGRVREVKVFSGRPSSPTLTVFSELLDPKNQSSRKFRFASGYLRKHYFLPSQSELPDRITTTGMAKMPER
jgi:hypothetical protein